MPKAAKGSAFEREVCRKLSLWWSGGQHDDWFWRTAGSGGRATNRAKRGKATANSAGDIGAECVEAQDLLGFITFELKRGYNDTDFQELLDHPGKSKFRAFIEQARDSATLAGTPFWALIVRRDRRLPLVVTDYPCLGGDKPDAAIAYRTEGGPVVLCVTTLDAWLCDHVRESIKVATRKD